MAKQTTSTAEESGSDRKKRGPKNATKKIPWTFPKHSLEDAIGVAKSIEEKHAGHPMRADMLAKALGFNQSSDWRFLDLLRSANQYGLVKGAGGAATVSLEQIGQDIVAPGSPTDRKRALWDAFINVDKFKEVQEFYGNKRIPEDEYFLNTLTRQFEIPRDRANVFAEVFTANLEFLKSFDVEASTVADSGVRQPATTLAGSEIDIKEKRVRKFLDTCFVMMPFGHWFDRYYQEIYIPAIREAGMEPTRADELFTTGSVVEQIWDQIVKSKVLLADLTNKNPNVFYELGLAHAAKKPVVFTAGDIDDVPFDLRHLRVIVYDVREPKWSDRLQRSITDYLRNTVKDPGKSIPHPFRLPDQGDLPTESHLDDEV